MQNNQAVINFVVSLLKDKLSKFYYYHNAEHTLYVMAKAIEIGHHQKCTPEEIDLLAAAGLWHDTGFINTYEGHEEAGCTLAKKHLPQFGYNGEAIKKICGMIMATKLPQLPKNKLEEIVADADLEYLGTSSAAEKANELFKERQHINPLLTKKEWGKTQIKFLNQHHYFTPYCKKNIEPAKQAYLKQLMQTAD
jgi:uncharacterized protein